MWGWWGTGWHEWPYSHPSPRWYPSLGQDSKGQVFVWGPETINSDWVEVYGFCCLWRLCRILWCGPPPGAMLDVSGPCCCRGQVNLAALHCHLGPWWYYGSCWEPCLGLWPYHSRNLSWCPWLVMQEWGGANAQWLGCNLWPSCCLRAVLPPGLRQ